MDVMIYAYELYDMVDIASLEVGNVIVRSCEEIKITELERLESGLDSKAKHYSVKDFLAKDSGIEYNFSPNNTSIVIENGTIIKMNKTYML